MILVQEAVSIIPKVKFSTQICGQFSVRLHISREFHYIGRVQYYERDQFQSDFLNLS